jgi:hypothetical protein
MNTHHPQEVIPNVWLKVVTGESRNFLEPRYCGDILETCVEINYFNCVSFKYGELGPIFQKIPWHELHSPPLPFFCH